MRSYRRSLPAFSTFLLVSAAGAQTSQPAPAQPAITSTPASSPKVVVRFVRDDQSETQHLSAADTRDGRITVGDVRISRPGFGTSTIPGAISVPSNTLSPVPASASGESLQQRNDRIDAQNRILTAEATIAEEQARATRRHLERLDSLNAPAPIFGGHYGHSIYRSGGYGFIGGRRVDLPPAPVFQGPVNTNVDSDDDQLHGRAQRNFSDAAAAASRRQPDLHRQAILEANRAATPPLIDQQNRRDHIQIEQSKTAAPKP